MSDNMLNLACRVYMKAGLSLIPIKRGTKRPMIKWDEFQRRPATPAEVDGWLSQGIGAIGVVCGAVSGGVEVLDFDTVESQDIGLIRGEDVFNEWLEACGDIVGRYDLPVQRTGSGSGIQLAWRCDVVEGNQKLAWVPNAGVPGGKECVIETRGEGGQALLPPSMHPSGGTYTLLRGKFSNIQRIRPDEREFMLNVARELTQVDPPDEPESDPTVYDAYTVRDAPVQVPAGSVDSEGVVRLYNERHGIVEALLHYGYTDAGHGRYSRPGQPESAGVSIVDGNRAYAHSSNDVMVFDRSGGNQPFSPFDLFAQYDHGGDRKAAVRAAAVELGVEYRLHTLLLVEGHQEAEAARKVMFPRGWVVRTMNGKADVTGDFDTKIVWGATAGKATAVANAIGGYGITMKDGLDPLTMARDGILVDYLDAVKADAGGSQG